jgi:hypothetical protein
MALASRALLRDEVWSMEARDIVQSACLAVPILLAGCDTYRAMHEPIFTGPPRFEALRPETQALEELDFPEPNFEALTFRFEHGVTGENLGSMTITRQSVRGSYALIRENLDLYTFSGRCLTHHTATTISLGGFLLLQSTGKTWSSNCTGWGAGYSRHEMAHITHLSGSLFPMKPGNRLELHYIILSSTGERDDGVSEYGSSVETVFTVAQRIPDYRLPSGERIGEVFVLNVEETEDGKASSLHEILFSESLGWRVGYSTDLRVRLTGVRTQ